MADSHFDELNYLQELLDVYEELGGSKSVSELVTTTRRLMHSEDAMMRMHSANKKEKEYRVYVFNDLLVIASPINNKLTRKPSQSGVAWYSSARNRSESSDSVSSYGSDGTDFSSDAESQFGEESSKTKFELRMWMDLSKVTPKLFSRDDYSGIYLTYVTMYQHEQRDGSVRWDTQVDRTELIFREEAAAKRICGFIQEAIDEMSEKVLRGESVGRSSSITSVTSDSERKSGSEKKWVKAKRTMEKQRAYSRSSKYSFGGGDAPDGVLTLDDIGDRYKKFNVANGSEVEAEFVLAFNSPSMGFALSSSELIGPFISKMVPGGMAEAGGVTVGDRIVKVNDVEIKKELSWKECANIIKQQEKPIRITFSRRMVVEDGDEDVAQREDVSQEMERLSISGTSEPAPVEEAEKPEPVKVEQPKKADTATSKSEPEDKKAESSGEQNPPEIKRKKTGKRKWAKKMERKKSYGNRILTMEDLAENYLDKGASARLQENIDKLFAEMGTVAKQRSNREYKCVRVLQEIHDTERKYVEHLSATVMDYQRPIKMKSRPVKCKDLQNGKPFCEHRKPQRFCSKTSAKKRVPLVDKEDMNVIFMNVELILKVNLHLIQALQAGLKTIVKEQTEQSKEPTVFELVKVYAKSFERVTPYFQIYWQYCDEYTHAVEHLIKIQRENKDFADALSRLEKKSGTNALQSMLIQPVQRLCRYPLLFEELNKSITKYKNEFLETETDPDKVVQFDAMAEDIHKAYMAAKKVADKVNSKVGEHKQLQKLAEIYAELGGSTQIKNLVKPWRYHVSTTEVAYENLLTKDKDPDSVICYMFNDLLVLAKPKGRRSNGRFTKSIASTLSIGSSKTRSRNSLSPRTKSMSSTTSKRKSTAKKGSRSSNNSGTKRRSSSKPEMDVIQQVEIKGCKEIKKIPDMKNDMYGFSFHVAIKVVTFVNDEKGEQKKRVDTNVEKLGLWLPTEEKRDSLLSALKKQYGILKEDEANFEKVKEKHGHKKRKKKYRRRMENRHTGSDMSRSHNRTENLRRLGSRKNE